MKTRLKMENFDVENIPSTHENTTPSGRALQELGDSFLSVGDMMKAQHCYEQAAALDTDAAGPYAGLGAVALQKNLIDDAEIAFRVACRLDPAYSKAYEGLGRVAHKKADHERAFEMYLKCLELDTNNLAALLGLFQISSQIGSFAKIIHYLEVYLGMHPGDSSVMFSLATLYIKESQFGKSKAVLLKILDSCPGNKEAENLLEEVEHHLARTRST